MMKIRMRPKVEHFTLNFVTTAFMWRPMSASHKLIQILENWSYVIHLAGKELLVKAGISSKNIDIHSLSILWLSNKSADEYRYNKCLNSFQFSCFQNYWYRYPILTLVDSYWSEMTCNVVSTFRNLVARRLASPVSRFLHTALPTPRSKARLSRHLKKDGYLYNFNWKDVPMFSRIKTANIKS